MSSTFEKIAALGSLLFGILLLTAGVSPYVVLGMGILGLLLGYKGASSKLSILAVAGIVMCLIGIYRTGLVPGTARKQVQSTQVRVMPKGPQVFMPEPKSTQNSNVVRQSSPTRKRAVVRSRPTAQGAG